MTTETKTLARSAEATEAQISIAAIAGAIALGTILIFSAGFAQATVMHDSAHDMRHALAFPCH